MAKERKNNGPADVTRDSFVYRLTALIGKWFLVSLLIWLCSIPVFTAGTAYCAALAVTRQDYPDLRMIFGSYFSHFSACFKKTAGVFLLVIALILLQVLNLSFYSRFLEPGTAVYYAVMGIVLLLILAVVSIFRFYCFEVTLDAPLTFKQRLLRALSRMMRCLPAAGVLALADIVLIATTAGAPVVIPVLLIYPGFHAFLTCLLITWFEGRRGREDQR